MRYVRKSDGCVIEAERFDGTVDMARDLSGRFPGRISASLTKEGHLQLIETDSPELIWPRKDGFTGRTVPLGDYLVMAHPKDWYGTFPYPYPSEHINESYDSEPAAEA